MTKQLWIGLLVAAALHAPLQAQSIRADAPQTATGPQRAGPLGDNPGPLLRDDVRPLLPPLTVDDGANWDYPLLGAVIGAVAGGLWGGWIATRSDDYVGPPPYLLTVPVGAAAGFVAGLLVRGK